MKTQINDLINGTKKIIRNMEDPKYIDAPQATSHIGYAGTNRQHRAEVAMKVYEENQQQLTITAKGIGLTLPISYSTTGKSWSWSCQLTERQYKDLGGTRTEGTKKLYIIRVNMDCTVTLYSLTRKSDAAQWRQADMTDLDESYITIL